tara:strand:- start:1055 stop:2128 length:1074 start_codon:yes stop_codon:yes gene_type:complete
MDTWKQKISNCHCWYPALTVRTVSNILHSGDFQELVDLGKKLLQNNTMHRFEMWQDSCTLLNTNTDDSDQLYTLQAIEKICNIANRYGCTPSMYKDLKNTLSNIGLSAQSLMLEQQLMSFHIVQDNCTCKQLDPGLVRTQGLRASVNWDNYPKRWKPYTTSYPLKDIDSSGLLLKMDTPQDSVEKYFHLAAQMNAKTTWKSLNETKYVDFSDGVYALQSTDTPKRYNSDFINFYMSTPTNVVFLPNGFGEHFEFYNNGVLANGSEKIEDLQYMSKTEIGDYINIDKNSHTDQFRSDCSLWYVYNQKRIAVNILKHATAENWIHVKKNIKRYVKTLKLTPPNTHKDRYTYWKYIKNIL